MSLTPGTRLGHYDVTALIGEGGMGQLYRACETSNPRRPLGRRDAMTLKEVRAFVHRYVEHLRAHDAEALARCFDAERARVS